MRSVVLTAVGLLALAAPASVLAAYPGSNGRIAITSDWGCDGSYIQTVRPNGSGLRPLTEPPCERDGEPDLYTSWAADGQTLVFNARRVEGAEETQDVMSARADGSDLQALPVPYGENPHLSPSSRQLVYRRVNEAGLGEIWIVNVDGSGLMRLRAGREPRFSPDGTTIAFLGPNRKDLGHPQRGLFLMSTDGTILRRLTRANVTSYDWSPSGRRLVYATYRIDLDSGESRDDLFTIRVDGERKRRLTRTKNQDERSPAWSPDGRWIAFVRSSPGKGEGRGPLRTVRRDRPAGRSRSRLVVTLPQWFENFPPLHPTTLSWQPRP
jgi:Tol biopolymer transport system component